MLCEDPDVQGVYHGVGAYADMIYIHYYGLDPEERGWDLLRWAVPQRPNDPVSRLRIFDDASLPSDIHHSLWRTLMTVQRTPDIDPAYGNLRRCRSDR